ncbi:efflux RND transporter periplasmic adaptor subunit [Cerasicoccus maritimus]|uniref:efflux RND transporter periplasmic adaptor subunit n=1 Tax=Cerasicoccus maritimus TaxID=490089 RepID=UPI0028525355|nr:efflux RND transporter periplasmic adaptor subunit [Cerasicoccus maritimus]
MKLKMTFKILTTSILTLTAGALAPTAFAQSRADNTVILDEAGVQNLRIETVVADEETFETTIFTIGRIEEIPANRSVVSSRIAGRVVELDAFEGDVVEKDQLVAIVESRQLGDPPPTVKLYAPQSGLVVASHVRLGQPVEPSQELMDISDQSTLWAVAQIPEQEAAQVHVGDVARIHVPSLGEQWIEAKLARFGVSADRQAGTVEGIFVIENPEGRMRPGMRAEFSIVVDEREFVLSVPRSAVQGDPSNRYVFVKDFGLDHAFIKSPVVLGEENEQRVEVIRGVFPGDEVVTRGSYGLSFAGAGSGMSLKEALDAAHGHEHNEDGSEMTPEQRAANARAKEEAAMRAAGIDPNAQSGGISLPLMIYAGVATLLALVLAQLLWNAKRTKSEGSNA